MSRVHQITIGITCPSTGMSSLVVTILTLEAARWVSWSVVCTPRGLIGGHAGGRNQGVGVVRRECEGNINGRYIFEATGSV